MMIDSTSNIYIFQVLQIIVIRVNNVSDIAGIVKNNVTLLTGIQCEKVGPPVLQY